MTLIKKCFLELKKENTNTWSEPISEKGLKRKNNLKSSQTIKSHVTYQLFYIILIHLARTDGSYRHATKLEYRHAGELISPNLPKRT